MPTTSLGTVVAENAIRFLGHDTHQHDEPHLVYMVTGHARLTADGEEWRLGRHEALWLAPRGRTPCGSSRAAWRSDPFSTPLTSHDAGFGRSGRCPRSPRS